jgi:hypothetical protein
LRNFLDPGEKVKADKGYHSHMDKMKCPANNANPAKKQATKGRVMARHEMLNRRLKNWKILSQVFPCPISLHGDVFQECAVVVQLTIKNGEPLFEVEYKD